MVFNFRIRLALAFLAFSLIFALPTYAQTTLNFDELNDATPVTTQYSTEGVTFSNTTAVTAGLSLNELEFPPVSGSNVVFDDSGPITGIFAVPIRSLSGYFTYTSPLTFAAFDGSGNLLTSVFSQYSDNTVSSGNAPDEFLQLSSPSAISSFTITGDPAGGSFTLDDFSFSTASANPVPEANSAFGFGLLLLLALGGYCLRLRSTRFLQIATRLQNQVGLLKLLPVVAVLCLGLFMALPAQAIQSVATPTADADYVFVSQPQTVTLTAQVSPDPQLITNSVNLVRVSSTGTVLGILPMYDNGTHGDKMAGDGTYTAQVNLDETVPGTATFYVTAAYRKSLLRAKSQPLNLRAVIDLDQAQITEYVNAGTEAGNKYVALLQREPANQARTDLVQYLLTLPDVSAAGITPDGTTVYFMIFGNLEEDIETDLFDSNGTSSISSMLAIPNRMPSPMFQPQEFTGSAPFDAPSYVPLVGNRKALLIAAFYDQFAPYDETYDINKLLRATNQQVDYYSFPGDATINVFKTMRNYGVVVITSHGLFDALGRVIIVTREKVTLSDLQAHEDDLFNGRIQRIETGHGEGNWGITPSFVYYYGCAQNSLVYVGSCFSLINTTMADAFLRSGAKTYFGYSNLVSSIFSHDEGVKLFQTLADSVQAPANRTTEIAYGEANINNFTDPYGRAMFGIRGLDVDYGDLALDLIDHITITPTAPSVTAGNTLSLTATVYDNKGEVITTLPNQLQWSSDTPTIATIANSGVMTGVSAGMATITVTDSLSMKSATVLVTVTAPPSIVGDWNGQYSYGMFGNGSVTCSGGSGSVAFTFKADNSVPGDNIAGTVAFNGVDQASGESFHGTQNDGNFNVSLDMPEVGTDVHRVISGTFSGDSLTASTSIDCVDNSGNVVATGPVSITATRASSNGNIRSKSPNSLGMKGMAPGIMYNASGHHKRF